MTCVSTKGYTARKEFVVSGVEDTSTTSDRDEMMVAG